MFPRCLAAALCGSLLPALAMASVIWTGDFETGNLSQWSSKLDAQPGTTDRLVVVQSPVRQGRHALKVTLKPGDLDNNGNRAELVLRERWFYQGEEMWYHWYTQFPSDYVPSPKWLLFAQWHSGNPSGVPLGFNLHGTQLSMRVMGHKYDAASNWTGGVLWRETLQKGKWMEFLLHVKWSDRNDGFVEMWKDGQLVVPKTFHPTLDPKDSVYLKFGLYRDRTITYDQTIFHDGMTIYGVKPRHLFPPDSPPDAGLSPPDAGPGPRPDAGPGQPPDAGSGQPPDAGVEPELPVDPPPADGGWQYAPQDGGSSPDGGGGWPDPEPPEEPPLGCTATTGPTFTLLALFLGAAFALGRRQRS